MTATTDTTADAATTTLAVLRSVLQEKFHVPEADIDLGRSLHEHDLDSLDVVELADIVEQELGARVTDDELSEAGALSAVVELIAGRIAAAG